ncbi:hypothetical protein PTR73_21275, partial [Serratia nevei]|uniref:hypothetical protein n=1 Tax=Serratia nevei TaxID=2703794 RepID=UPI00313D8961
SSIAQRYDNAQRCPQGEATGRINPARPTHSEKSALWRFFRICSTVSYIRAFSFQHRTDHHAVL